MLAENLSNELFGNSISGYHWILNDADPILVLRLCQKFNISEALAKIMVNRGIKDISYAQNFLEPKIKNMMPDPFKLKDMDKAATRLANAVTNNEKIAIFGDYDVDGATSTALLRKFFRDLQVEPIVYIPNRLTEGYGPNPEAFKSLKDQGCSVIITVDCGSTSFEAVEAANEDNVDIVILDHHLSGPEFPDACAIVNPNRSDEDFEYKSIAAVGVCFLAAIAIRAKLRSMKWFEYNPPEPDLMMYLDLVALGTVCDVIKLSDINRAFVAQGIKIMSQKNNVGIAALADISGITSKLESYHLGYMMGPRINAGGRIGESMLGAELLSSNDATTANSIAQKLNDLNEERKALEMEIHRQAMFDIKNKELDKDSAIIVCGDNWHQGVLGIIASRIKERYRKPVIVISVMDGVGKGSARSIEGINLGALFSEARDSGILLSGGGHAMAGGLTISEEKIPEFQRYIAERIEVLDTSFEKAKEINIDSVLTVRGISYQFVNDIMKASPFGNGNPIPKFILSSVKISMVKIINNMHLMVIVHDEGDSSKQTLKCMLFRGLDTKLGKFFLEGVGKILNIVGTLQINNHNNNKVDFIIEDACM